ncbi:MAG: hypothetical protein IPJ13_18500 [Saprospiraceae bacterium]|nr:hypothetical protein [Saprospiraceae bacterium]
MELLGIYRYYWIIQFLLLFICVISEIKIKKKDEKTPKNDEFNREGFAMSILEDIKSKKDIEHSYNYGLVGEWGSGKSFLMEKMFEKMQKDNSFVSFYFKTMGGAE